MKVYLTVGGVFGEDGREGFGGVRVGCLGGVRVGVSGCSKVFKGVQQCSTFSTGGWALTMEFPKMSKFQVGT